MTRHAKRIGRPTALALALALALVLPLPAAAEQTTEAPASPGAEAVKPAPAAKPPQPAPASKPHSPGDPQAPAAPRQPEAEPARAEEEKQESWDHDELESWDKISVLSDVEIPAGKEIRGDVVCIGGDVKLLGKVRGDVVVIAGSLDMHGSAGGVVGVASKLVLRPGATIRRDLVNVAGALDRNGESVGGQVINVDLGGKWLAHMPGPFGIIGFILFWITFLKIVLVFIGLLLLAAIAPDRIRLLGEEAPLHPFLAFFAGLGGYIVLALTMILLCITIIGIPAALLLYFAFVVVKWMGLAGIFQAVGRRIGRLFGREFSLLGAVLLGFLPFAVLRFLPFCVGSMIWFVLDAMAVGIVVLTRFGTRRYGAPPAPAAPPPPAPIPAAPGP